MTGTTDPVWVPITDTARFSRPWLLTYVPHVFAAWETADPRRRPHLAAVILRAAADAESDIPTGNWHHDRWAGLAHALDPRLTTGPDWLPLAAALTRAELSGYDVDTRLPHLAAEPSLPDRHPARDLHWRLVLDCPQAVADGLPPWVHAPGTAGLHSTSVPRSGRCPQRRGDIPDGGESTAAWGHPRPEGPCP